MISMPVPPSATFASKVVTLRIDRPLASTTSNGALTRNGVEPLVSPASFSSSAVTR